MKLVVVGGVAGGASAAARVRRLDEAAEIKVFERGEHVSYSNCALPYYLGGVVEDAEDLILMTPEDFSQKHRIDVCVNTEVIAIDRAGKRVRVRETRTGREYEEPYDKLVLSPGASPIRPRGIRGVDRQCVFVLRSVTDVIRIQEYLDRTGGRSAAVIGGGFIGLEAAENLKKAGKAVSILESARQLMTVLDYDMVQAVHKELDGNGVAVYLNSTVTAVEDGLVRAEAGGKEFTVPADVVILAVGVAPETALAGAAGLELGETKGIRVNEFFQTSDPDIYAVGDAVESFQRQTGRPGRLALAGPAQRQARIAADHMYGLPAADRGFLGSSCIRVFTLNAASTGLNETAARAAGLDFDCALVYASDKVGLMPGCNYMALKLLFEVPTGKLLGAQAVGKGSADQRVNVIAALIGMGGTLEDLRYYEHCYAPLFSTAKDVVHMAGLVGSNLLGGRLKQVRVDQVRDLVEHGAYIVDVREEEEFAGGHIKGAHNIPLSCLRDRMGEIPRDRPVYLHCRSGQRSYYAYCALTGSGFGNVVNISGSFLGLSLYEYFNDKTQGRTPIVTAYNFE